MEHIFSATDLAKTFKLRKSRFASLRGHSFVNAVDSISFDVNYDEIFGIVGESGCGKTTVARLIMRLEKPTSGTMKFKGEDISALEGKHLKKLRQHVQIIFQDPYSSLNPVKSIFYTLAEPLWIHKIGGTTKEIKEKVRNILDLVGLPSSDEMLSKRPDELSGGERQRIGIGRALILEPEFIVADEPVSMLDASVRAEIVNLMISAKAKRNLTYIFITHEIDIAYAICDRIAVMYAGRIIEMGNTDEIIKRPTHPYTKLLVEAIPPLNPKKAGDTWGEDIDEGECAYYIWQPRGCKFQERCKYVQDICREEEPLLKEIAPGHFVACHQI